LFEEGTSREMDLKKSVRTSQNSEGTEEKLGRKSYQFAQVVS